MRRLLVALTFLGLAAGSIALASSDRVDCCERQLSCCKTGCAMCPR